MNLGRFFAQKRQNRNKARDELDIAIDIIEKSAPRQYKTEREIYFYNYRIMHPYRKPLLLLLNAISLGGGCPSDQSSFSRDLFLKLKNFYDLKDRLTLEQALNDISLKRKYRDVFLFFYGRTDPPPVKAGE